MKTKTVKNQDSELIKKCLEGKTENFAKLIALYQSRIEAVGWSFFHNKDDTEDFVQDVFIKAYTNLASFMGKSSFSTWLTSIAYTTAINAKNKSKNYETIADENLLYSGTESPEEAHIKKITAEAVKEAIKELPQQYAICLDFYFFYELSHEEISIITGFPVNTIKSHIFRAKKILRQKLKDYTT